MWLLRDAAYYVPGARINGAIDIINGAGPPANTAMPTFSLFTELLITLGRGRSFWHRTQPRNCFFLFVFLIYSSFQGVPNLREGWHALNISPSTCLQRVVFLYSWGTGVLVILQPFAVANNTSPWSFIQAKMAGFMWFREVSWIVCIATSSAVITVPSGACIYSKSPCRTPWWVCVREREVPNYIVWHPVLLIGLKGVGEHSCGGHIITRSKLVESWTESVCCWLRLWVL